MQEVRVQLAVDVVVPEYDPMRMVDVGIAAEHLFVHVLNLILVTLGKSRRFADPAVCIFGCLLNGRKLIPRRKVAGGENGLVLALARNPGLDMLHIRGSWQVYRVTVGVNPVVEDAVHSFSAYET